MGFRSSPDDREKLTVTNDANLAGDSTLGSSPADTITVKGKLTSSAGLELGAGSHLNISSSGIIIDTAHGGNVYISGTLEVGGSKVTGGGGGSGMTSFQLEDGDGTEVTINNAKEVKFVEGNTNIDIDWTDTSHGSDGDPYDMTFTVGGTVPFTSSKGVELSVGSHFNVSSSGIIIDSAHGGNVVLSGSITVGGGGVVADDQKLYFGTGKDAAIEYDEAGADFLIITGSAHGTVLSGALIRVVDKLTVGADSSATSAKTSGIFTVEAAAADTTNGLIATFRSSDTDYGRINIDNSTADGDTQFTFMSNGSSKWSVGNMGSNETFHIKSGFGDFADTDPFILTSAALMIQTPFSSSLGLALNAGSFLNVSSSGIIIDSAHGGNILISGTLSLNDDKAITFGTAGTGSIQYQTSPSGTLRIHTDADSSDALLLTGTVWRNEISLGNAIATFSEGYAVTGDYSGEVVKISNTTSLVVGKIYYLHTNGTWTLAQANDANDGADGNLLGVALGASSHENGLLLRGLVRIDNSTSIITGTPVIGNPLYLCETTAGNFNIAVPGSSGEVVRLVGYVVRADGSNNVLVYFNPSNDFVVRA